MKRDKRNKHIWEESDLAFLKENYMTMTNKQLASGLDIRLTTCRTKLYELGLKRMEMEYWTPEQVQFLHDNYKTMGDVEMAELFNEVCPKNKPWSKSQMDKKRGYLQLIRTPEEIAAIRIHNTKTGRFTECAIKRWKTTGVTPIGEIKLWKRKDGGEFAVIKLEEGFVHYNRWLLETSFYKLKSDELVVTKSNELIAKGPEDLEVITRSEHSRRNTLKRYPEELRQSVQLIRKLKNQISKQNEQ